jgi:hypothetical protein
MTPRVSICVPNLNTLEFLPERFGTIFEQTFRDWELLVYDSYSDDGAWQYITGLAACEPRMRAWQGPREGTPASWNPCIRQARGEYVYIATSDDTMPPDCLATLVSALDAHPECDLAHCRLRPIDPAGREIPDVLEWWSLGSAFALSSGALRDRLHIRRAPLDGLLHLLGGSVYTSITQLLIRRSLLERIGLFEPTWGSVGDFHWSMRAGLAASCIHVPDTWGGWRLHTGQATAAVTWGSAEHARKIDDMIQSAIDASAYSIPQSLCERLVSTWAPRALERRAFMRNLAAAERRTDTRRRVFFVGQLLAASAPAWEHLGSRVIGRAPPERIRRALEDAGFGPALVPVTPLATRSSASNTSLITLETPYENRC